MAQILVIAVNKSHIDPVKDQRGCYKRGMCVGVFPDDHIFGNLEGRPNFVVIKVPLIPVATVEKYIQPEVEQQGLDERGQPNMVTIRRRQWKIRVDDLPAAALTRLANDGELIIKATDSYTDTYDYTWAQVKSFFRDLKNNVDESADL